MSAPGDLTSLAVAKQWLGVTSSADDGLLSSLVSAVSQAILADLGRASVLPATYVETCDGGGTELVLRQWPVAQIASVLIDGQVVLVSTSPGQAGWVLEPAEAAPPGAPQRLLYRGGGFAPGCLNVTITYTASYQILGETALVPATAPFIVGATAPFGAWALDTGVSGAAGGYSVSAGVYTFQPAAAGQPITLSYGYIPNDLAQAACEWVADRYASRTRIGQSAKTLGGQETTSFIVKAMPDVVDRLLQPYRWITR